MDYQMTGIHMHLIPGVDDGAMDTEMALRMLNLAREQEIHTIFATPHSGAFDVFGEETRKRYRSLLIRTTCCFQDMALYLGCEVYCNRHGMNRVPASLDTGRYPSMNGTRYVLAEFSQWATPETARICTEALIRGGWKPIIAHMERYHNLRQNGGLVDTLREMGCRIQINTYSVFGEEDPAIRNWARQLVAEKKVDFLGTDAHRTSHRPPSARQGLNWLYKNHDRAYIDAIAFGNARRLLIDRA